MFDPFVAEVAALNPTFAQPVASSIPSGDVTGGRPSRSLFKEFFFIVRKSFLYLAFGAKFLYNVFLLHVQTKIKQDDKRNNDVN